MDVFTTVLMFGSAANLVACLRIPSVAGPFRVVPGHLEKCPPELEAVVPWTINFRGLRDRRDPNVWYYSGNATTSYTLNDSYLIEVRAASWGARGGWRENAHVVRAPRICSILRRSFPAMWRLFMTAVLGDPDADCPVPAGTYSVNNISTASLTAGGIKTFFYGKWRVDGRVLEPKTLRPFSCLRAYGSTVPKV